MKKLSIIIICFFFISTENAFAEILSKHIFKVGPEISYLRYKEPGHMKEQGLMYGISASYSYHNMRNLLMVGIEGKASYGELDYKGATIIGTPLNIDNVPDYMLEFRGLIGLDLPIKSSYLTPYIGIGYRYLNDDTHEKYSGGYEREANYFYSPVGFKILVPVEEEWSFKSTIQKGWTFGVTAEFDVFWDGTQKSHLEDLTSSLKTIENDQDNGYGLRGSITLQKKLNNLWIGIEPFIKYWHIKASDPEVLKIEGLGPIKIIEPRNYSTELGAMLLIVF